jgi:hypothetical protein
MTSRPRTSRPETPVAGRRDLTDLEENRSPRLLAVALVVGAVAALASAVGGTLPVVAGAVAGYLGWPLLAVLALAPVAVALGFALRHRPGTAAGVLAGLAVLVPGRLALDLQFAADPSASTRPELYLPATLGTPAPAAGFWALLAGLVGTGVAGLFAVRAVRRRGEPAGAVGKGGQRWIPFALVASVLAAFGLLMAPLRSDDAYLVASSAFEAPLPTLLGSLLLAVALPVACVLVAGSEIGGLARGSLLGLSAGVLTVSLPDVVAGLVMPAVHVTAGSVLAVLAALALAGLAGAPSLRGAGQERTPPAADSDGTDAGEARLPGPGRLRLATGVVGLLTALAAIAGGLADPVVATAGGAAPQSPAGPLLVVAGVLVGVVALVLLIPATATAVRPVLSVAWAGVVLAGTGVLGTAVAATELGHAYSPAGGVWLASLAMLGATVTACLAVVAGMVEREDEDAGPEGPRPSPSLLTPLVAAGILAIGAFGTPTFTAPDYVAPGLWSNFGPPSWGLLVAVLTVLGAAALAPRSRPARAVALLLGAAAVLGLRALELPLTGSQVLGSRPGTGLWLALAAVAALLVAAVLAAVGPRGDAR